MREFHLELVSLLASCAEGEDRYIQSLCQSLISLKNIYSVLLDKNIPHLKKAAYIKFFHWAYLKNPGEAKELDADNLFQRRELWDILDLLTSFELTTYYQKPGEALSDDQIEWVFESYLPLLDTVMTTFYDGKRNPASTEVLMRIAGHIQVFSTKLCGDPYIEKFEVKNLSGFVLHMMNIVPGSPISTAIDKLFDKYTALTSGATENPALTQLVYYTFIITN